MNKKDRETIAGFVAACFFIPVGYVVWFKLGISNVYTVFGIPIIAAMFYGLTLRIIPSKKNASKKSTKNKQPIKTTSKNGTSITSANRLSSDDEILKLPLEKMSWKEFERLCFMYYKAKGYKPELTKDGADGGVDLTYYSPYHKAKVAVQIKHRIGSGNQIETKLIRELVGSKRNHNCLLAEFITTGEYSNNALAEAGDRKIECHNLAWVENKIVKWQKEEAKKKKLVNV
ncbi:restriction endonuclease [Schinkia sp. CFF1]